MLACFDVCSSFSADLTDNEEEKLTQALLLVNLLRSASNTFRKSDNEDTSRVHTRDAARHLFRRFDYDDAFGAHPNNTDKPKTHEDSEVSIITSKTPITASLTTAIIMSTTTIPSTGEHLTETQHETTNVISTPETIISTLKHSLSTTEKVQTVSKEGSIKIKVPSYINEIYKSKDPIIKQVAFEFVNEVNDEKNIAKLNKYSKKDDIHKSTKEYTNPRNKWSTFKYRRPTMKLHLSGSSRYPIPYPENHAFCFTNPNNALCRTLIR
ncbi:hypothetical protein K1T71_000247 [Dendrolimus kikuchii]|uniref:Uncharacterized protein n=1 Tax=Dendrolimus kikuchii TaxID=765133 RepID=A0ACC1DIM3_9NEOP|nr:hypothetical protein K1T71_000247 [Dendrolimus kikuchii]